MGPRHGRQKVYCKSTNCLMKSSFEIIQSIVLGNVRKLKTYNGGSLKLIFCINAQHFLHQVLYRGSSKCQDTRNPPSSTKSMIFCNNNRVTQTSREKWIFSNSSNSKTTPSWRDRLRFCPGIVIPTQVRDSSVHQLSHFSEKLFHSQVSDSVSTCSQSAKVCSFSLLTKFISITLNFPTIKTHSHLYNPVGCSFHVTTLFILVQGSGGSTHE